MFISLDLLFINDLILDYLYLDLGKYILKRFVFIIFFTEWWRVFSNLIPSKLNINFLTSIPFPTYNSLKFFLLLWKRDGSCFQFSRAPTATTIMLRTIYSRNSNEFPTLVDSELWIAAVIKKFVHGDRLHTITIYTITILNIFITK